MAEAELKKLAQTLAEIQAIKFGSFKLTSGKLSPYYIDLRLVPSHPQAFRLCVEAYQRLVRQIGLEAFDLMVGVPTAGVVFASVLAYQTGKPLAYVRKEAKDWGLRKAVEGRLEGGERILLVDDLVTTGKSILETAEVLREAGGKPTHAVVLIDREEGGAGRVEAAGISLHAYVKVTGLLEVLKAEGLLDEAKFREIMGYLKKG
ncbi:MAG: orotate phosphoribosyltransferase [Candidatus Hecatellaceae archaeon]